MPFGTATQPIDHGLLEASGEEQCEVQAGTDLAIQDRTRRSNLLAIALEALRRQSVDDPLVAECRPDRFRELPGAGPLAGLVAVERWIAPGLAQLLGSVAQHCIHGWIVRPNKSGDQFGGGGKSSPFRGRQKLTGRGQVRYFNLAGPCDHSDLAPQGLSKT